MILDSIRLARTRDEVVDDYAELLIDRTMGLEINWAVINMAIIEKWSIAGLRYIKERAYKVAYPNENSPAWIAVQNCPACGWPVPDCVCVRRGS